jgi:polygalacturonase
MKSSILTLIAILFVHASLANAGFNIDDFGAVADEYSFKQALLNGKAFNMAVSAANSSDTDRTVIISPGKNYTFLPDGPSDNLINVTVLFDGIFYAWHENENDWPKNKDGNHWPLICFTNTLNLMVKGNGVIEGNGYMWWWTVILTSNDNRPDLFTILTSRNTVIDGITVRNGPQYHMNFLDALNMTVQNIVVKVELNDKALEDLLPTFPLNTDGIDISGRDIYFRNLSIQNYDDAVAVKPMHIYEGIVNKCSTG